MSIYPDDLEEIRDAIVVAAAIQAAATIYAAHRKESLTVEEAARVAVVLAVTTAKTMAGTK